MNIEEVRMSKFKKIMITILLAFTMMVILSGLNKSYAMVVESITGSKWNIDRGDYDYNLACLYNEVQNLTNEEMITQRVESNTTLVSAGNKLGATSAAEYSFNRRGTLLDCGTEKWACKMICYEPTESTGSSKIYENMIRYVLFVSEDKVTLYYPNEKDIEDPKIQSNENLDSKKNTIKNILSAGLACNGNYSDSKEFARIIRSNTYGDTFQDLLTKFKINKKTNNDYSSWNYWKDKEGYKDKDQFVYYGVFVFYGHHSDGQGRLIYNIIREPKVKDKTVKVKMQKTDMEGVALSEQATIKITLGENAKFKNTEINSVTKKVGNVTLYIEPKDTSKNYFKLNIEETKAPGDDYVGFSDTITLTVYYKDNEITRIESTNTKYIPNTNSGNLKIKNEKIEPLKIRVNKRTENDKKLLGSKFKVSFQQDDTDKYEKNIDLTEVDYANVTFKPSNKNKITVTVTETTVPTNYSKVVDSVKLEFTWNKSKLKWIPSVKEGTQGLIGFNSELEGEYYSNDLVRLYNNLFRIKIKNCTKTIENLKILKTDSSGSNKLNGAEFQVYLNNVKSVTYNNTTYTLETIRKQKVQEVTGFGTCYVYKKNGLTFISPSGDNNGDKVYIQGLKTNANGEIVFDKIVSTSSTRVFVTVTETKAPEGYSLLPTKVSLVLLYENSGWKLKKRDSTTDSTTNNTNLFFNEEKLKNYVTLNSNELQLTLKDDSKLDSLTILKTDSTGKNKINGAKFTITLTNIKSIKNYSSSVKNNKITLIDINGNITLEDLVINNINNPIVVTIEETTAPTGYKKINGKITITLEKNGNSYEITKKEKETTVLDSEYNSNDTKFENNKLSIGIKNTSQQINLGGIVWKDGQTGEKDVKEANGIKDNTETGLGGIKVTLYKEGSDTPITKDSYGNNLMTETAGKNGETINYRKNNGEQATITLSEGEYIFPNLEGGTKYFVVFGYDGINYKTTNISSNVYNNNEGSKATEIGREEFNNKFKTIAQGEAISQNESNKTKLEYEYSNTNETTKLKTTIKGENPANSNATDFQMTAKTSNYLQKTEDGPGTWKSDGTINTEHYALDINCGLIEKEFDLAIGTDVKEATLKINEKQTTYKYAQIMDGALNADFQNSSSKVNVEYNLYLYYSDYNFRIDDYKTDMTNKVNPDDNKEKEYENLKELEAYVTYSVILKSQTKGNSTVEEFVYYYDSVFEPDNIVSTDTYDVSIDKDARKITFTSKNGGFDLTDSNDYRATIDITFKVNKDSNGNIITKTATNVAEITKYSTSEGGLIDKDSAPGNANVTFENGTPKVGQYEDDTDEAKGLNIVLNKEVRIITGTVFEDKDKNGKNDDNTLVNDVIVQLIEIKKISGKNYEYIWQETRSGSNQVKTTTRNGYDQEAYENTVSNTDTGKYEFKDFIPGNYIVRFIYGDGTTYDLTETVKKYNGQDYKSTIDEHYKEEWYNSTKYTETSSVAVDNEARRLEVMAYSTKIDTTKGTELKDKTKDMLDATWMCAETSKINVGVEDNKSNKNINFGLAQRPNTKLVLEKHITSLKITPQGTGVQPIVEARLNIDKILGGSVGSSDVEGIKTGLSIIKSTRTERGFWKVETDIEELAQGAKVELEYTYVIKNEGDEDYLSSDVIGEYTTNIGKDKNSNGTDDYVEYLKGASETAKASVKGQRNNSGSYLGQYYYTGTKGTNDASVLSTVTKIEDNLNNNLKFVNTTNPSFTSKNGGEKVVYDANGNDNKEKIETVLENIELFTTLGKGERDTTKTANLETTLSASSKEIAYPTYIGEITEYTNAAGRKDMESTPTNLSYVHSEDTNKTMENSNEADEFWGEKLIVSKPTGEDKQAPVQAIIIATTAIATIGVGIILIKKFVLKK